MLSSVSQVNEQFFALFSGIKIKDHGSGALIDVPVRSETNGGSSSRSTPVDYPMMNSRRICIEDRYGWISAMMSASPQKVTFR